MRSAALMPATLACMMVMAFSAVLAAAPVILMHAYSVIA